MGAPERDREHGTQVVLGQPVAHGQAEDLDVGVVEAAQHLPHDQHVPTAVLGIEIRRGELGGQGLGHRLLRPRAAGGR
ncbi:MAG TPA: hypothetical protein VIJ82_20620 [Streptosporangiaceae bacterium]